MIRHSSPTLTEEEIQACADVLRSGYIAQGAQVEAFEQECATYLGRRFGIAVNSGTNALILALEILEISRGARVAIPSYVCSALATAVLQCGAAPVLCDCRQQDHNMDPHRVPADIPVVAVHLFGAPAPLPQNPLLIEDIAQAIGAPVGKTGKVSIVSFYATKLLTTGEGGMLFTDDDALAQAARDLRDYDNRDLFRLRHNFKMTDLQAAIGRAQLRKLDGFIKRRREIAQRFNEAFAELPLELPQAENHVYARYVVGIDRRDELQHHLSRFQIEAKRPVYRPLHHYPLDPHADCPNAERAHHRLLSLPIYPSLKDEEVEQVIEAVRSFF